MTPVGDATKIPVMVDTIVAMIMHEWMLTNGVTLANGQVDMSKSRSIARFAEVKAAMHATQQHQMKQKGP